VYPEFKNLPIDLEINSENSNAVVNIGSFLNTFFSEHAQFKKFQQSDSHEFLISFLDTLVQKTPGKNYTAENDSWNTFLKNNKWSEYLSEFYGQTKMNLTCLKCKKTKCIHDSFESIHLNISLKKNDITSLFIEYLKKELNNDPSNLYYCDNCKSNQISEQKVSLNILPKTLILVLKRYSSTGTKLISEIYCDPEIYIKNNKKILNYHLTSIVSHSGNLYDGHYTAFVKIHKDWYYIDDCTVSLVENMKFNHHDFYILFYTVGGCSV